MKVLMNAIEMHINSMKCILAVGKFSNVDNGGGCRI